MYNKKGQGLSTNAIILIVLGIFVLAILILGFTLGWSKIAPWISTTNVDDVVQACSIACSVDNQYDFCTIKRDLKGQDVELKEVTCNYLSKYEPTYNVQVCPIACENILFVKDMEPLGSLGAEDCEAGMALDGSSLTKEHKSEKTIQSFVEDKLLSYNCPKIAE